MFIQDETFEIRLLGEGDLAAALAVYQLCEDFLALTPQPTASMHMVRADWEHSLQCGGAFCGIYRPDGVMVGVVDVVLKGFEGEAGKAFIELLMIGQPYRGSGLGSKVVEVVETAIRADKAVQTILTAVMVNNPAALRFWEWQGYQKIGGAQAQADGTVTWRLGKAVK